MWWTFKPNWAKLTIILILWTAGPFLFCLLGLVTLCLFLPPSKDPADTWENNQCKAMHFWLIEHLQFCLIKNVVVSLVNIKALKDYFPLLKLQAALQFLEGYGKEDITLADLEGNSNSLWTISPPSREKMIQGLLDFSAEFTVVLSWSIQR